MSVQIAMMAGMAAMAAYSAAKQGQEQGAAMDAKAGGMRLDAAGQDVTIAENRAQAQNEELQRRKGLERLMSANRADLAGRGVSAEQGSSYDVISDYNTDQANTDINNIRFMGESRVRKLSFARESDYAMADQYGRMGAQSRTSGFVNAGLSIGRMALSYYGLPSMGGGTNGMAAAGTPGSGYYGPVYSGTS